MTCSVDFSKGRMTSSPKTLLLTSRALCSIALCSIALRSTRFAFYSALRSTPYSLSFRNQWLTQLAPTYPPNPPLPSTQTPTTQSPLSLSLASITLSDLSSNFAILRCRTRNHRPCFPSLTCPRSGAFCHSWLFLVNIGVQWPSFA